MFQKKKLPPVWIEKKNYCAVLLLHILIDKVLLAQEFSKISSVTTLWTVSRFDITSSQTVEKILPPIGNHWAIN